MEVMNRAELTQTDILVGQKTVTRSFGVSDDPMLMSMLSTGFYQNPLRTMIQEVMFNAWDAHRMAECQHRPIDIYINDTTGLIIRDYGPGIEPGENDDNMHEIYCMYGGSTKRKLKNQTGGFGLGSKSPFAYTESFTVTSHFGGMKNMYLISRVSESNGGKPGMTSLVRVPTTETGLMVTVPLKAGHLERAYEAIKDVLFLSGIKAMVHYMEEPDEFIDSLTLPAGSYFVDDQHTGGNIWAVYGGVRYQIPRSAEYEQEYEFMKLLGNQKDIFVGFAPDTLSPLPNREGLNMGEKSKDSVKSTFERCTEKFQGTFEPATRIFFKAALEFEKARGIQGHFAFIRAADYGCRDTATNTRISLRETMIKNQPCGVDDDVWKIATELIINQTGSIRNYIGRERWKTLFLREFVEVFPHHKDLAFAALKNKGLMIRGFQQEAKEFITEIYGRRFIKDQMIFIREMKKAYPNDDTLIPQLRICQGDDFDYVLQDRGRSHLEKTKYGIRAIRADDPRLARKDTFPSLEKIYKKKSGEDLDFLMMEKTVLIAKTVQTLKNSSIPELARKHLESLQHNYRYYNDVNCVIPGYVVYERKGSYDKALEILTNLGWTVIEGEEPEKKVYVPKAKQVQTYPRIMPQQSDSWQSVNPNDQYQDPTHFYYATLATIRGYDNGQRPDRPLIYWFLKKNPKTVTVTNTKIAENLLKKGAIPFHEAVIKWYETTSQDTDRMTNIIRASQISNLTSLPDDLIRHPLMQLELGMDPVDPKDEDFWYESEGYNLISGSGYYPLRDVMKKAKGELELLWKKDPEKENIIAMCSRTKFFQPYALSSLWSSTKPNDRDEVVNKIIAAMKLFG